MEATYAFIVLYGTLAPYGFIKLFRRNALRVSLLNASPAGTRVRCAAHSSARNFRDKSLVSRKSMLAAAEQNDPTPWLGNCNLTTGPGYSPGEKLPGA